MEEKKRERYEKISQRLTELVGGVENIQGVAHCATRLRIVLKDNDAADLKQMEDVDLVKGVFVAGDQVQIIFGAGLVNDVYQVFAQYTNMTNMSLSDLKTQANQKMNPIQRIIKALSDVFIDIMPGILAAALLTGLSGVLGNFSFVESNETLFGINKLINIASGAIFGFLPLAVAYSACKRFGGRPILGIVMGCIMLSPSLADAYAAAQGTVEVTTLHIFGLGVELVGFQGGIIVALLMGVVTAKLDIFFEKKVPEVIRLLVSPLLTTLVGAVLLFLIVGPVGRGLASGITTGLVWMTQNFGAFGYALFSGLQQLVVITGLHHIFGAIEAQLLVDTGRNFLNPLMSVAMTAQGGAVLGYMMLHKKDAKTRELCIPSFISVLFGITEPALFGVNVRYRFPLIAGCIGGAVGGLLVYFTDLAALGFGTTVVPGIALADPKNNGYISYILVHLAALAIGFLMTLIIGAGSRKKLVIQGEQKTENTVLKAEVRKEEKPSGSTAAGASAKTEIKKPIQEEIYAVAKGRLIPLEEVQDDTFAQKILGDGAAVIPAEGKVFAPGDGTVTSIFDTRHAICFETEGGTELLIHIGIDTVKLGGKYFVSHVQDGQKVKKGQLLVEFEKEAVEKEGYDTVIPMIVTNLEDEKRVVFRGKQEIAPGDSAFQVTALE